MRALTIRQPWASLIALEQKRIETRSFATKYRGPVLIHAGASATKSELEFENDEVVRRVVAGEKWDDPALDAPLPRGQVLAVADLVDVITTTTLDQVMQAHPRPMVRYPGGAVRLGRHERSFGDYAPGREGWVFDNVQRLSNPVPAAGKLGLWIPPLDVLMPTLAQVEGYTMPEAAE